MGKKPRKDYIRDNNKVRNCIKNEIQMNVLEHVWYYWFVWGGIGHLIRQTFRAILDLFIEVINLFDKLVTLIFFPITFPVISYIEIKTTKERVERGE